MYIHIISVRDTIWIRSYGSVDSQAGELAAPVGRHILRRPIVLLSVAFVQADPVQLIPKLADIS